MVIKVAIGTSLGCCFIFFGSETAAGRETSAGGNQPSERAQAQAGKVRREGISSLGRHRGLTERLRA